MLEGIIKIIERKSMHSISYFKPNNVRGIQIIIFRQRERVRTIKISGQNIICRTGDGKEITSPNVFYQPIDFIMQI